MHPGIRLPFAVRPPGRTPGYSSPFTVRALHKPATASCGDALSTLRALA